MGVCVGSGGLLFLLIAGWLSKVIKKRNDKKRKEKFFKRNGGFLLQQEKTKLFNSNELDKATNSNELDKATVTMRIVSLAKEAKVPFTKAYVPLLVNEFIPNGTLFQHIHNSNEEFPLSWEMHFRITTKVARALSYLHYAASIYHRDIKSTNIRLDDKYKAKVSDFGTSRSIAIDQTQLTTLIQGTFGYLDLEYF
ncbi:hypothetical protein ACSBR1_014127 [Camellia fascicularis]